MVSSNADSDLDTSQENRTYILDSRTTTDSYRECDGCRQPRSCRRMAGLRAHIASARKRKLYTAGLLVSSGEEGETPAPITDTIAKFLALYNKIESSSTVLFHTEIQYRLGMVELSHMYKQVKLEMADAAPSPSSYRK